MTVNATIDKTVRGLMEADRDIRHQVSTHLPEFDSWLKNTIGTIGLRKIHFESFDMQTKTASIYLKTRSYEYHIVASAPYKEANSYLSLTVATRYRERQNGVGKHRSLLEGELTENDWQRLVRDLISYELLSF